MKERTKYMLMGIGIGIAIGFAVLFLLMSLRVFRPIGLGGYPGAGNFTNFTRFNRTG